MTPEEIKEKKQFRDYIMALLNGTDLTEEEKEFCIKQCPAYLSDVVLKHLERESIEDKSGHVHTAILGFVGGYAIRHLYAYHKKNQLMKGQA